MAERRTILLGKIGSGKSATGNTIFMRKRFPVSRDSQCILRQGFNQSSLVTYHVFDTPGIAGKYGILPENCYMIHQQMVQYCNEPHVFLLIVDPAAHDHTIEMITALKAWFGMSILDHTILVFTKGIKFNADKSFPSRIRKSDMALVEKVFGRRIIKIENHGEGRSKSQRHLLSLIDSTCYNGKSSFLVTPKPHSIFNRGVVDRCMENRTFLYEKPKQQESLNGIPIPRGTKPPRQLNKCTQGDRINAFPKRPDDTDVPERSTNFEINNEDTEHTIQVETTRRKQGTCTTAASFENDVDRMNKEVDLKTQNNHETQIARRYEGECREPEYLDGTLQKVSSQTEITTRKPLQRKDIERTLECAFNAGKAVTQIKTSPLTSITRLALIASNEENVEAIKNVIKSEEVQIAVESTLSFFKEAAIGVANFITDVAQQIEENRRRHLQLIEERKRRSTHTYNMS